MVSIISLAENDDSHASDSVLLIGHLVSSNRGLLELDRKSSKMWLWWKAPKNKIKTKIQGAFHLVEISGISGSAVNGTRFVGKSHWKIPRKSGKSKKVVPFSRLEFPNGMSCSIDVSCSLYKFQVHGRAPGHVPGFTSKWNNFLPIGNSTFATTEISFFFS